MKDWFKARNIWGASIMALSDAEAGRLAKALWSYTMTGEQLNLSGAEKAVFALILMTLSQDDESDNLLSQKRAIAGSIGGKQKVANQAIASFATNEEANEAIATNKNKNKEEEKEEDNKEKEKRKEKQRLESAFDLFYTAYPRKQAKQDAVKAFMKLAPDEDLLNQMLEALDRQKQSQQWRKDDGQFIPLPATWLNGKRWLDQQQAEVQPMASQPALKPNAVQNYEQRDYSDKEKFLMQRFISMSKESETEGA